MRIDIVDSGRRLAGNLQEDRKAARRARRLCKTDIEGGSHEFTPHGGRSAYERSYEDRKSHQFLVAFAALGKIRNLVYRWLSMLVRHKFSLPAEDLRYGISLKKAYMAMQLRRAS
ncbi:hypothetical protein [Shinella sp. M27]|uniref:hypothetical protein n=1 Tax=Shinella sp. M27 TaxID=3368614 RepID=UPI003BA39471